MAGSATLTTALSRKAMLEPRTTATRIQGPASALHGTPALWDRLSFIAWWLHELWMHRMVHQVPTFTEPFLPQGAGARASLILRHSHSEVVQQQERWAKKVSNWLR